MKATARSSLEPVAAAQLLRAIANSLQNEPSQFNYQITVNATGFKQGSGSFTSQAIANAPAENVIGAQFNASFGGVELQLARSKAEAAFIERMLDAATLIREIADCLADSRDEASIRDRLSQLAVLTLPALVIETVKTILDMAEVMN